MTPIYRDLFWVVLLPVSWIYSVAVALALRIRRKTHTKIPVISVGNLHLGGTGKTPAVIQLSAHFRKKKPAILSRGYRSRFTKRGAKVEKNSLSGPRDFGDEPWEMSFSTSSDIFVGADRLNVLKKFDIQSSHGLIILDDGYQHVQISRAVNLLIIPGDENPWESACFPLGTLREGLGSIKRASLVGITASDPQSPWVEDWKQIISQIAPSTPLFVGVRKLASVSDAKGNEFNSQTTRFGAFCGIGRPQRFESDITHWARMDYVKSYADHHAYTKDDVQELIKKARACSIGALITTSKDFYKVADYFREADFPLLVARTGYEFQPDFWQLMNQMVEQAC